MHDHVCFKSREYAAVLFNFYAKLSPTLSSLFFQRAYAFSGASA
jgi:hypothetical protein